MRPHVPFHESFRVTVVPSRVAYLIGAGSRSGFRRAVAEASTRWAGITEPIITVAKNGTITDWHQQVIELSQVCSVVNVDVGDDAAESASTRLGLPLTDIAMIDRSGIGRFSSHPLSVRDPGVDLEDHVIAAATDAPLWEIASAGTIAAETDDFFARLGSPVRRASSDQIARAALSRRTWLDRTRSGFGETSVRGEWHPSPAILMVVKPNDLNGCLLFWNVRALQATQLGQAPTLLLPHQGTEHWTHFGEQLSGQLQADIDRFENNPAVAVAGNLDESSLHEIARRLGLQVASGKPKMRIMFGSTQPSGPPYSYGLVPDPRQYAVFGRDYGRSIEASVERAHDCTMLRVSSPVRVMAGGKVLLRIASPAFDGLPRGNTTAEMVTKNGKWHNDQLQLGVDLRDRWSLPLTIPALDEVVWMLAQRQTARCQLSDKGQLAGALDADRDVLLNDGVMEVIRALTTPRSKELSKELKRAARDGETAGAELIELAQAWGRAERQFRSANQLREITHAASASEALVAAGWTERGVRVRCTRCLLRSFVALHETTDDASCPACRSPQSYLEDGALHIQYRLNAAVDRASDQGVIPHLLAVAALHEQSPHTHVLPGLDVEFADGTVAELDLFGVHDGWVISGEAKTSPAEFSSDQLQRDVQLSKRLGADLHVLASPLPPHPEQIDEVRSLATADQLGLIVIAGASVDIVATADATSSSEQRQEIRD